MINYLSTFIILRCLLQSVVYHHVHKNLMLCILSKYIFFFHSLKRIEKYLINSLGTTFEISHEDKNQTKMFSLSRMSCLTKKSKWFVCELGFLLSININLKGEDRFCHHAKSSIWINRIWQWFYLQQKFIRLRITF